DLFTTSGNMGVYNGTNYTNLAAYQTASGKEKHSVSGDPGFTSSTDLHASAPVVYRAATPLSTVTDDIDGQLRNSTYPCIGADEFIIPDDAGIIAIINPTLATCAGNTN